MTQCNIFFSQSVTLEVAILRDPFKPCSVEVTWSLRNTAHDVNCMNYIS